MNDYIVNGDITTIIIKTRKGKIFHTYIDTEDLPKLIEYNLSWHIMYDTHTHEYYVKTSNNKYKDLPYSLLLHRFILDIYDTNIKVDHKSHDQLDNRKENLRATSNDKNTQHRRGTNSNSSTGVRNVNKVRGYKKELYLVQFQKNGEKFKWEFSINQFEEACKFAEEKRKELFGEYAGAS
jgi:hypothetical protein